MHMQLSKICDALSGKLSGEDVLIDQVSTDTRKINPGDCFVALTGPNFNGHEFISQAKEKGAIAAIVSEPIKTDLPTVLVKDTRKALGQLASFKRSLKPIPLVAITGSCGKTTTKTMLASIMQQTGHVLFTQGTYNNDIGMPLTLLQQQDEQECAVIEMGTNHFGEISYLTNIAKPDVAMILNIGKAHLEGLGNCEEGVAKAKGEIFEGLSNKGVAVLNRDDAFFEYHKNLIGDRRFLTFGMHDNADVYATDINDQATNQIEFVLHMDDQAVKITLPTIGRHNVSNALAAAAGAKALGVTIVNIKKGLEAMMPVDKRLITYHGKNNSTIIDDSYNAIPNAIVAAMEILCHRKGTKVFAFGGMGELGEQAEEQHIKLGETAKALGVDELLAIGPLSLLTIKAFGSGGEYFETKDDLIKALQQRLQADMTVLVKGARVSKMEEVVSAIREEE